MAGCVPERVRRTWNGHPRPIDLQFDPNALETSVSADRIVLPHREPGSLDALPELNLGVAKGGQRPVDVTWPVGVCLERHIALPAGAIGQAGEIARLDLVRDTPIDLERVIWRHVVEQDDATGTIRQFVLKRRDLAALTSWLARQDLTLRKLRVALEQRTKLDFVDNVSDLARPWRPWRMLNAVLVLALIGAVGYLIWHPHDTRQTALIALEGEIAELQATAIKLRQSLDSRRAQAKTQTEFIDALATHPRFSDLLGRLSERMPDHSWVETIDADHDFLRITGQSRDSAADLIAHLSGEPKFRLPELIGPVTRDARQDTERFTIQIRLGSGE